VILETHYIDDVMFTLTISDKIREEKEDKDDER
jgi:hypothetical protein